MSLRRYLDLPVPAENGGGCWQIHYRYSSPASSGRTIVLLHPSPMSSVFMQPIMQLLSDTYSVIAWDTPGYGQSDPLPAHLDSSDDLMPYVEALQQFLTTLEIEKPIIYGSATGAQIAIEYAKAYANQVTGVVLENAAWFTDQERDNIIKDYFPSIAAKDDGKHLLQVWKMVSQLYEFFPWFDTREQSRVSSVQVPAEMKHQTLLAYFAAGEDYAKAYRAAFMNERPEQLRGVTVPTELIRWQSGILKRYVDRLDDADLPDNIRTRFADAGIDNRFRAIREAVDALATVDRKSN
jgi:pimeloyl-ACP methyl ester carboxylesterase